MTNIIKRHNGQLPATFGSVIDQLFHNNLSRVFDDNYWGFNGLGSQNQVPVNIQETEKSYEMALAAPGLKKEDFKLSIDKDLLTVSFENSQENSEENQKEGWLRREFQHRSFSRSFNLDDSIDATNVSARYQDGVLYVTLPKKEEAQKVTRLIDIQ